MMSLRFRNRLEAAQAIGFLRLHKPIPEHLILWPFVEVDGKPVPNGEYHSAKVEYRPVHLQDN